MKTTSPSVCKDIAKQVLKINKHISDSTENLLTFQSRYFYRMHKIRFEKKTSLQFVWCHCSVTYPVLSFYSPRVCEGRERLHCRSVGRSGLGTSTTAAEMTRICSTNLHATTRTELTISRETKGNCLTTNQATQPQSGHVNGMSNDRYSWPILSVNKIGQQKSVTCHVKIGRFCWAIKSSDFIVQQKKHVLFSTIKSANFLDIGHHGDCLQGKMNIYFSYLFSLLLYNVYFRSLDADKIMQVSFCDLQSTVVY